MEKHTVTFSMDTEHPITIPYEEVHLDGLLHIPQGVVGTVIFAHGSGSSRFSPRNQFIARTLQHVKLATLLFDLLTPEEEAMDNVTSQYRFDIDFLSNRLMAATDWITHNPVMNQLPIGYFGASTGGGAALVAGAKLAHRIKAIVSRGGRPDLAGGSLSYVKAPTLLIVGGDDTVVIELNQHAFHVLPCEKKLEIIPGATHLFEEPGALEAVAHLADAWFVRYLK